MDFHTAEELLALSENMSIADIMRRREIEQGETDSETVEFCM